MQTLIKQIREYLNMSQTELAEQLNVTFATVNRWENGRAVPNKLAQTKLYEICKKNDVPVYDITLNRIAAAADCRRERPYIGRACTALSRFQIRYYRKDRAKKPLSMRFREGLLYGH